jgi:predicted methyltransferase
VSGAVVHRRRRGACALAALVLLALWPVLAPADAPSDGATSHRSFADVPRWEKVFDDPGRAAWQQPAAVVAAVAIEPGMLVADVGAGTGYFSRALSEAVGPRGAVLAVEVEPNLVTHLRARAEREGTVNVIPVLGSPSDPRLPAGRVDRVLFVDTYHHIDGRIAYFTRLRAALSPGGRVVVVDWEKREDTVGPELSHRLAREQVVEEMTRAGYAALPASVRLPHQYVAAFAVPR